MKVSKILPLTFLFFSLALISCKHESELLPGTPEVCFDSQILPVIQSSCTMSGCHTGSGELPALSTYEDIRSLVEPGKPIHSKLHKVLTENRILESAMPPKPNDPLNSAQIDAITIWILQGANHTTCNIECDTVNVTFNGSILPITDTYCKGCHSGTQPSGGILLVDYASIKTAVEGGRFVGAIDHSPGYSAMPQGGDKLSDCNIVQIKKWINQGMPN
jgi:hypothetical protein